MGNESSFFELQKLLDSYKLCFRDIVKILENELELSKCEARRFRDENQRYIHKNDNLINDINNLKDVNANLKAEIARLKEQLNQ